MSYNEADTRAKLIDPVLHEAGWHEGLIEREYPYKRGRISLIGDEPIQDQAQFVDYVLRGAPNGAGLATLEAKEEALSVGSGLQQAVGYAQDLGVSFAYSSNGHGFVEHDLLAATEAELERIPGPEELLARLAAASPMHGASILNRRGDWATNPLLQPMYRDPAGRRLRYYQESAVNASIRQILMGRNKALLALATGTGKTVIAAALAWKLVQSGYFGRVLFLVDRINLLGQAYNRFGAFGEARGVVVSDAVPLKRDIHFATYQTLYSNANGSRVFEEYPRDFFDLVIIDECHRSGYGDWREVLEHFDSAFHLGMTATPKRTDSIDTYEFFASENRNEAGEPEAAYVYSFGQGIDDGFLATYQVHRVRTNIDRLGLNVAEEVAKGAELYVPPEVEPRDVYGMQDFEREITVPDRTAALCEHLATKLLNLGPGDKTIVFCVNMEHAELVKREMQNRVGAPSGNNDYAARIVSEEKDAQLVLERFQDSGTHDPVLVTTVDLLTTGVDIPSVRNIVFMKPVASPTVFKQIIGRGSRLDEPTGKMFFRVIDYTNATRLFDEWDVPGTGGATSGSGAAQVAGRVVVSPSGNAIAGATVAIALGMVERRRLLTAEDGGFVFDAVPPGRATLVARAAGYCSRRTTVDLLDGEVVQVDFELKPAGESTELLSIRGVEVGIVDEEVLTLDIDGHGLSTTEYKEYAAEQVRLAAGDLVTLGMLWRDPETRKTFRQELRAKHVDSELLALVMNRPDVDDFDLLAAAAFGARLFTREERARQLENFDTAFLSELGHKRRALVELLLDQYRIGGIDEISAQAVRLPQVAEQFGGVEGAINAAGGSDELRTLLTQVQRHLYPIESEVA